MDKLISILWALSLGIDTATNDHVKHATVMVVKRVSKVLHLSHEKPAPTPVPVVCDTNLVCANASVNLEAHEGVVVSPNLRLRCIPESDGQDGSVQPDDGGVQEPGTAGTGGGVLRGRYLRCEVVEGRVEGR